MTVALDLEAILEAVRLARDLFGEAVQLQLLAVPLLGLRHHLVDVLVVLGGLAQGREEQTAEREREHEAGETDL